MKSTVRVLFLIAALTAAVLAAPASASASSWTKSTTHYNIYFDGGFASMPFSPPSSVPRSGTSITGVSYSWLPYDNGNYSETVQLCYRAEYSSTEYPCVDVTAVPSGTRPDFNGLSARGSFVIRHTISGGTYPAFGGTTQDTVTVTYTP